MIDSYRFGHIVVDGTSFDSDVMILPDGRVDSSWWRKEGHALTLDDINVLVAAAPEIIVAGTGASGRMRPEPALADQLDERGMSFKALPTDEAVDFFNEVRRDRKAGACLHLTC